MNKYTLQFKDNILERKFQQTYQIPSRKLHLKFILFTFLFLQIFKLVSSLIETNMQSMYVLFIYIALTLVCICYQPETRLYQNLVICLVNLSFTIYVLFFDKKDEITSQYFKGGNQMIFCIVNLLLTEFVESAIMTVVLFGLRSAYYLTQSTQIDIPTYIVGLLVNVGFIYIQYNYIKAQRSQYLLSQTNFQWERALQQLMHQQEFLFLFYDENKNSFNNLIFSSTQHFQKQENLADFLRKSIIFSQSLEQYLFGKINKFQANYEEVFNKQLHLRYQNKIIEVNYSLFFGSRPTILVVFSSLSDANQKIIKRYNQIDKLLKFIVRISKLIDYSKIHSPYKFQKIIISMHIVHHQLRIISQKLQISDLKIRKVLHKLEALTKCRITKLFDSHLMVKTIPNIFYLLLLIIINSTYKNQLMFISQDYQECFILVIKGSFNIKFLEQQFNQNQLFLMSIIDTNHLVINQSKLEINFQKEILMPYLSLGENALYDEDLMKLYNQLQSDF